jgi:hypothetical protein
VQPCTRNPPARYLTLARERCSGRFPPAHHRSAHCERNLRDLSSRQTTRRASIARENMAASLAHRGADAVGLWREAEIGLGHRMRWTTPESLHEALPFVRPSNHLAITCDARLDNRDELIALLEIRDRAVGDSSLILHAYERWGEGARNASSATSSSPYGTDTAKRSSAPETRCGSAAVLSPPTQAALCVCVRDQGPPVPCGSSAPAQRNAGGGLPGADPGGRGGHLQPVHALGPV